MDDQASRRDPARLSELAPEVAATVVRVAGDIALVIGNDGVIRNVADGRHSAPRGEHDWVGMRWADTVSQAARGRAETLLREAREHGVSRRSELNHPGAEGSEIPFTWAAVRLGDGGPLLAVGRDMRAVTAIQQRFQDSQLALEREYWQRRNADGQHRQLFQVVHDAVLVLDAESGAVLEANAAAAVLLGHAGATWEGVALRSLLEEGQRALLDELLAATRTTGAAAEARLRTALHGTAVDVAATLLHVDEQRCLLVRARRADADAADPRDMLEALHQLSDAVVVADSSGHVLCANPAFVALCRADDEAQVRGRTLAALLADDPGPWTALLARVQARGLVEGVTVSLGSSDGRRVAATVSAVSLADGDQARVGLVLRPQPGEAPELLDVHVDLTPLSLRAGRATLPELLAEAARLAEIQLIESALRQGRGRVELCAQLLRISPQELLQRMSALALPLPRPLGDGGPTAQVN